MASSGHFAQPVRDFLTYLRVEAGLATATLDAYGRDLRDLVGALKARRVADPKRVTPNHLIEHVRALHRVRKLQPSSIARHLATIRVFFRFLKANGAIEDDPTRLLETPTRWKRLPGVLSPKQMRRLLEDSLEAGAVGLSTGLEYAPGWHADSDELLDLATVVARHGGLYSSHIRNRASSFVEAVDEALSVGRECGVPVQLSHLAPRPYAPPGILDTVLERIDNARAEGLQVGVDTVIETWGPGPVASLLPPGFIEAPTG